MPRPEMSKIDILTRRRHLARSSLAPGTIAQYLREAQGMVLWWTSQCGVLPRHVSLEMLDDVVADYVAVLHIRGRPL